MYFCHAPEIWRDHPQLVPGVLLANGITEDVSVARQTAEFETIAASRLATHSEGQLPEVQAWRRIFSRMGLKATQYRCASESLLRRFKKERSLPHLHPLVDLCNSVSLAFAIPVAVFDVSKLAEYLEVRYATGFEVYETFSGQIEHPEPHEAIFADAAGRAHARRWTNRQSGYSAVRKETSAALIVAEGVHASAQADVRRLMSVIADAIMRTWSITAKMQTLTQLSPRFKF